MFFINCICSIAFWDSGPWVYNLRNKSNIHSSICVIFYFIKKLNIINLRNELLSIISIGYFISDLVLVSPIYYDEFRCIKIRFPLKHPISNLYLLHHLMAVWGLYVLNFKYNEYVDDFLLIEITTFYLNHFLTCKEKLKEFESKTNINDPVYHLVKEILITNHDLSCISYLLFHLIFRNIWLTGLLKEIISEYSVTNMELLSSSIFLIMNYYWTIRISKQLINIIN